MISINLVVIINKCILKMIYLMIDFLVKKHYDGRT